ncbi:Cyclopropane-fatty-acyl-phospholipid synthase [Terriglobus saanensis SP1PR4]|uniref:Cyclopropane-fatty-acyl-phospholipid synthase n=2 Tax=Terriglobus saanensis TaxID=870903 RepID=E8V298_TERSS|nr:Cyclopropane-fatty-acyl-phospholipid synthase [Terriglobus saanensis SP1PR4]
MASSPGIHALSHSPESRGFAKRKIDAWLESAGVSANGNQPWDPQVIDDRFYNRVLLKGSLGLGESYMEGWWECEALDEFFCRVLTAGLLDRTSLNFATLLNGITARLFNLQTAKRAWKVGETHYDVGNDLYKRMLDSRLVYTCAYWQNATTLDEAQEAKLDLVCRKIGLQNSDHILDIGCGWGSFAKFAASRYGAFVDGVTISREQVELGNILCREYPVNLKLMDYRNVDTVYDHIVSLGMFEHVGNKNYRTFFQKASQCLKDDGLFLLHTIGSGTTSNIVEPWIMKHIFPNGMIPSMAQIGKGIEGLFVIEDVHNFGADYDRTLMQWFENFDSTWSEIKKNYPDNFYRKWKYYLLSSAGAFRSRHLHLWQIVLSKRGVRNGYARPR